MSTELNSAFDQIRRNGSGGNLTLKEGKPDSISVTAQIQTDLIQKNVYASLEKHKVLMDDKFNRLDI